MENNSYMQLTQDFFCSLVLNETYKHALDFRMLGTNYQLTPNFIKNVYVFAKDGVRKITSDFNARHL